MIVLVIIISVYSFVWGVFALSFLLYKESESCDICTNYSVLIAARNEEKNIKNCISSILIQSIKPISIIVVDDNSEDNTFDIVQNMSSENALIKLVSHGIEAVGKRNAIISANSLSETDINIAIDADCVADKDWAKGLLSKLEDGKRMVSGAVVAMPQNTLVSAMEYAEVLYLNASGAGAANIGLMFQASGANMAFYKEDMNFFYNSMRERKYSCGDDVFFLQFIKNTYGCKSVGFNSGKDSVVLTNHANSFADWVQQRLRWSIKSVEYKSLLPFCFGLMVILANLVFVFSLIGLLLLPQYFIYFIAIIFLKVCSDMLLLISSADLWRTKIKVLSFFSLTFFYPFFLIRIFLGTVNLRQLRWKGRSV